MKKLYIVRHAQKEDEQVALDDYDIQLSSKGIEDAKNMAKNFASKNPSIDLIISSPAKRTKETSEIFAEALEYKKSIMPNDILYRAFVNELIETISYTFDTINSMLLVGHNPSLTALAITLVDFREEFKMGAIMEINFDCDSWMDISKENAKLISYETPDK
jgi:phosphohistidine phosphatase